MRLRILVTGLLLVLCTAVYGQNVEEHRERKKQIEDEISNIDKQLSANKSKREESLNNLILTRQKLNAQKNLINQINSEIKGYENSIAQKNAVIATLREKLDTLREYHAHMVRGAYKTRDPKIWFMYLLSSQDLNQGLRRWSYLKNISNTVHAQADLIRATEADIRLENAKIQSLMYASMDAKAEGEREKDKLAANEKKENSMVVQLQKKEKQLKKDLKKKQEEVEKLNKEIERILAEAVKKQQASKDKAPIDYKLSGQFAENKGKLPRPVSSGIVILKFGQNYHPVFKNLKLPDNNGINISAPAGSEAKVVFDGTVKQILVMPGYDQCVLVQHGEYFTFYCKLNKVYVKSGDRISTGTPIGVISTNEDGNAELHFQLWKGTAKQNPESWLRK